MILYVFSVSSPMFFPLENMPIFQIGRHRSPAVPIAAGRPHFDSAPAASAARSAAAPSGSAERSRWRRPGWSRDPPMPPGLRVQSGGCGKPQQKIPENIRNVEGTIWKSSRILGQF